MPSHLLRAPGPAPTPLWTEFPGGPLATECSVFPCGDPCGPPPPPSLWVRGTLCACSSSGEAEAWIRAGDLADLRTQGSCPTGRLPDGSCWEVLAGAEEREFPEPGPPASQRLAPHGVGGCCVCCPGCRKRQALHVEADACPLDIRSELRDVCCPVGGFYSATGYSIARRYDPPSGCYWFIDEVWWQSGAAGTAWVRRSTRLDVPGCTPRSETVTEGSAPLVIGCDTAALFIPASGTGGLTRSQPIPIDICDGPCPGRGRLRTGTNSARYWYELDSRPGGSGSPCVKTFDERGFVAFNRTGPGACKGRCIVSVLTPIIPPLPAGGDSVQGVGLRQTEGGILVPDNTLVTDGADAHLEGGCAGCGDDGGL